jgi:hypothetical protein
VNEFSADMGGKAHHADGDDLADEAHAEALGEQEASDASEGRGCDASPEVQLDGVAREAVVVGMHYPA